MYLQVDAEGYVTGYTAFGGFVDGMEVDASTLPTGFADDFWPRKYRLEGNVVAVSGVQRPVPESPSMPTLQEQVDAISAAMLEMILGGGIDG